MLQLGGQMTGGLVDTRLGMTQKGSQWKIHVLFPDSQL